jgi:hypothetical protein
MPTVDGSTIKDLPVLPNGWYDAKFDKYELKTAQETNNPYDACEFVFDYTNPTDGTVEERRAFYNMTITEKTMWRWKRDALSMGAPSSTFDGEFDTEDVLEDLLGNPVRLHIVIQTKGEYAGRNQTKEIKGPSIDISEGDDEVDDN